MPAATAAPPSGLPPISPPVACARFQAVALVQHLVGDVRGEVELEARRVRLQRAVQVNGARRLEERAHHAAQLAVLVAREHGLAVEPAHGEPVLLAQAQQVLDLEREAPLADALGRALEVREVVARHLLVRADQQVRELPAGGAGLREQLGDRRLQQLLRKQERGLERHAGRAAGALGARRGGAISRVVVEKPARLALEERSTRSSSTSSEGTRLPLSIMLRVGHRGRALRVELGAARGQLFQREAVALSQRAQLGAEEVALAGDECGGYYGSMLWSVLVSIARHFL